MRRVQVLSLVTVFSLVVATAPAWAVGTSGNTKIPAEFTGVLLDLSGKATVPITLHVDNFATAADVGSVARILGDKGQRAVVADLAEMKPRGWIRVGSLLGFEVPIIREFATPKGQRIYAVLDRPFPLWEQLQGTRSPDYPFGMIELKLDLNGNGSGKLVPAGRAMFTREGKVEMVDYGTKPYRIIGVTQQPVGR